MAEVYDDTVMANSRGHWTWQYHDNPRNPEGRVAIRVVDRGGDIVAMICGIRQLFWLNGHVEPGLWVVDFMARQAGTDSRQRLRYGQRLAFELRDTQPLVAGVNRPALNRYWKRILGDHVDICAVPMMLRPLRLGGIARRKLRSRFLGRVADVAGRFVLPLVFRESRSSTEDRTFEIVETFDDRFDRFWERVAPTFSHLSVRDAAFLNWRYRDIPCRSYTSFAALRGGELVGWVVTRWIRAGGLDKARIVDMLASREDADTWRYLIHGVVAHYRAAGADLVHGLGSTVAPVMDAYRACGFRTNPEHARTAQYIAYTSSDAVDKDAFYRGDNWYVTLGDADTDFATPE